jgi:hypothetical protein
MAVCNPRPSEPWRQWQTPADVVRALQAAGLDYEVMTLRDGFLLRRPGHPIPWDDLLETALDRQPGALRISIGSFGRLGRGSGPTYWQVGRFVLQGHPDELARVAEALRR